MKIRIYQINPDRDKNRLRCVSYENLEKFQGTPGVNSDIYDCVYETTLESNNLEDVFYLFNKELTDGFKGHSLLVSDIIEVCQSHLIEPGFYYCDRIGFCKVDFDPTQCGVVDGLNLPETEKISVLLVEPGKAPKVIEIPHSLKEMQRLVDGYIEAFRPFDDDTVIICNEEGKICGYPLNRAIYREPEPETMTYVELKERFCKHEQEDKEPLEGYVVFSEDNFNNKCSEIERTFVFSSKNEAFMPDEVGDSIDGYCLAGGGQKIRLDQYIANENPGDHEWKVERFYTKDKSKRQLVEIIAGTFFICYAPIESEQFSSLPSDLAQKYAAIFRNPERFIRVGDKIIVIPIETTRRHEDL